MTLMDFYDKVEDQFTPETLKKLMKDYYEGFNREAVGEFFKENAGSYNEEFHNFEIIMFNRFIDILHSINNEDDALLHGFNDDESFRKFFMTLVSKFKSISNVHSYEEMEKCKDNIISNESEDFKNYVNFLYKKFGIVKNDEYGYLIYSGNFLDDYSGKEYKHSLTLNSLNVKDSNKIVSYFIDRCDKDNIPFYINYSYNFNNDFDDIINIHSSNNYLFKYIEYLNDFKREYPDIVSKIGNPNLLFGKYDGWIGYLNNYIYKDLESSKGSNFYKNRLYLMRNVCFKEFEKWLSDNINNTFSYEGEKYSFKEYLVHYFFGIMKDYSHDSDELLYREIEESINNNYDEILSIIKNNRVYSSIWSDLRIDYTQSGGLKCFKNYNLHTIFSELALNDDNFVKECCEAIREEYKKMGINEKCCFVDEVLDEMKMISEKDEESLRGDDLLIDEGTDEIKIDNPKQIHSNELDEEFLDLLQELKNASYDRKERSKYVVRVEQIIEIYRNDIHNDEFADTLVKAFNNAQKIYEDGVQKMESKSSKSHGKHFKSVHLEDNRFNLSDNMESKIDDEVNDRVQKINENVYKTSSQKVDESLDEKMAEINKRVDNGETLDSKIDDLSRYVSDLNKRRAEISERFKEISTSSDEDEFDKLKEEDNDLKNLISNKESEIERRARIREIVDEQIEGEIISRDIEEYASDVDFINNSSLSEEQKKILIDGIYAEFDKYVEEHPEEKGRRR